MKRFLLALIALLIAIQLVIALLLGTESGSRWLIYRSLPLLPGDLQISEITGNILDGVSVKELVYQKDDLAVHIASAELAIETSRLWKSWLYARHINIDGLKIYLPMPDEKKGADFLLPDELALPLGIAIESAQVSNIQVIQGHATTVELDLLKIDHASIRSHLTITRLVVRHQQHRGILADVDIKLMMPYSIDATLDWQSEFPALSSWFGSSKVGGQAQLGGSLVNLTLHHQLTAPQSMTSQIEIAPFSSTRNFTSQHQWEQLALSLPNEQTVELSSGTLKLDSSQSIISLTAESQANLKNIISGQLKVSADGDWQQAKALHISIDGNGTQLNITGTARWLPEIAFNLIADGQGVNPALISSRLAGRINTAANLNGQRVNNEWRVIADSISLTGLLHGKPLQATAHAALIDSMLSLNGKAEYDGNRISVDGRINQAFDLHSKLQIHKPQSLHPELRGKADINLHLYGNRNHPLLDIDASSTRFGFAEYSVDNVAISGRQLGLTSDHLQLSVSSDDIRYYSKNLFSRTSMQLTGSHDNHRFSWTLVQEAARLSGSARGAMESIPSGWNGVIDQLTLNLTDLPDWRIRQPATVFLSNQQQRLGEICLSDGDGQACAEANSSSQGLSARLAISALPLKPFSALLGPEISLAGEFEHSSNVRRDQDGNWDGSLHSELTGTTITFDDGPVDYSLLFNQAELSATLDQQQIKATLNLAMSKHGHLNAALSTGTQPDSPIEGQLNAAIGELRWLELLIPGIRQRSGSITGKVSLSGRQNAPQLRGQLTLEDGETDIADAGISLQNVGVTLNADGKQIRISGNALSGPGSVDVTGQLDLAGGLPGELDLKIAGERFQILNLPEALVLINPAVSLAGTTQLFRLRGNIDIPEAALAPQQLPDIAVRVSEDQVIVNSPQPAIEPVKIDTELMLIIGKDVRFNGFGLEARLGGNLQFIQKPEQPTNLLGDLRIEEGRYRAYGQNLAIDRGVLLFQEDIDNPGLNIRAVRRIPSAQVVAGVAITGTLQKPDARLISEPAMEESEIMAWLLTGRGLTAGSESDNAMIAQALAVYGLEQGSGVTEKIGDKLGLDEIAVGSDWETSDASVMLGKQISDRLYLRYAIGLFDAVSTVMLRYTLSRRLHLEAQSGSNRQSLDLIYQVER